MCGGSGFGTFLWCESLFPFYHGNRLSDEYIAGFIACIPALCILLLLSLLQFDLLTVSHAMPGPIHLHLFSEVT